MPFSVHFLNNGAYYYKLLLQTVSEVRDPITNHHVRSTDGFLLKTPLNKRILITLVAFSI